MRTRPRDTDPSTQRRRNSAGIGYPVYRSPMSIRPLILVIALGCSGQDGSTQVASSTDSAVTIGVETLAPMEICINEFAANTETSWVDETGASPDWIEIHNPTAEAVSLGDYRLSDDAEDLGSPLSPTLSIPAGGFLVFSADAQPELGPTHLPFSLNAEGESVGLFRTDGAGERFSFGTVRTDVSWARVGDCCPDVPRCVVEVPGGSPEASNGGS